MLNKDVFEKIVIEHCSINDLGNLTLVSKEFNAYCNNNNILSFFYDKLIIKYNYLKLDIVTCTDIYNSYMDRRESNRDQIKNMKLLKRDTHHKILFIIKRIYENGNTDFVKKIPYKYQKRIFLSVIDESPDKNIFDVDTILNAFKLKSPPLIPKEGYPVYTQKGMQIITDLHLKSYRGLSEYKREQIFKNLLVLKDIESIFYMMDCYRNLKIATNFYDRIMKSDIKLTPEHKYRLDAYSDLRIYGNENVIRTKIDYNINICKDMYDSVFKIKDVDLVLDFFGRLCTKGQCIPLKWLYNFGKYKLECDERILSKLLELHYDKHIKTKTINNYLLKGYLSCGSDIPSILLDDYINL